MAAPGVVSSILLGLTGLHIDGGVAGADLWFVTYTLSEGGSVLTTRVQGRSRLRSEWGSPVRPFEFGAERVPDKLVLRSGFDPPDLHAVVNLLAGYVHGQAEFGAIVSLLDRGSVLMGGTPFPYWFHQARPQDESVPLVRRFWGGNPRRARKPHHHHAILGLAKRDRRVGGVERSERVDDASGAPLLFRQESLPAHP